MNAFLAARTRGSQARRRSRALTAARAMLTLTATYGGLGAFIADWNETHIYNPNWPPHAKFHNAQTMSLGAALLLLASAALWAHETSRTRFAFGAALASTYCSTQLVSLLFPGTALTDQPHDENGPQAKIAGALLALNAAAALAGWQALPKMPSRSA